MPVINTSSNAGILFSLFVVAIAALNLIIDFDFVEKFIEHVMYISNNKTEYESRLKEIKQELWKNTSYRRIDSALRKKISTLYDIIRRINLQIPLFLLDTNETIELLKYEEDPTDIRVINAFMENANRVRIRVQM